MEHRTMNVMGDNIGKTYMIMRIYGDFKFNYFTIYERNS